MMFSKNVTRIRAVDVLGEHPLRSNALRHELGYKNIPYQTISCDSIAHEKTPESEEFWGFEGNFSFA
jgi:hypothetical protein